MRLRPFLPAVIVLAVAGCGISVSPRVQPRAQVGGGAITAEAVQVEYSVQCGGCYVEFTTPTGADSEEDVSRLTRRFRFFREYGISTVTVRAVPADSGTIEAVAIRVNGKEVSASTRVRDGHVPGEPVVVSAALLVR